MDVNEYMLEVTRDYEDDNLEEQWVVRRGQDGEVQVCGGGGQLRGQQEV